MIFNIELPMTKRNYYLKFLILLTIVSLFGCKQEDDPDQGCNTLICDDEEYPTYEMSENVVYGINASAHKMTVYQPTGDLRNVRPLIILLSGGGFELIDISRLEPLAKELTKYGFVVATAGYRTGDRSDGIAEESIDAVQDSKAAVRYFRAEASTWKIDPNYIVIGGWSAGAITALSHAYVDENEVLPELADLVNQKGGIEGTQGNNNQSSSVKAVISLAGVLPEADNVITAGEAPVFAVHGTNDSVIPNTKYPDSVVPQYSWFASSPLVEHAKSIGITAEVVVIAGGHHSTPVDSPGVYIDQLLTFLRTIE